MTVIKFTTSLLPEIASVLMMTCTLYQLVVAVHRKDAVNCDEAEITGSKIQEIWIKLTSLMHISKRKINLCHW